MSTRTRISKQTVRSPFVTKVEELSGQNLLTCYQCGKCSAGCPMVAHMDIIPNQIVRFTQLGFEEELLKARSIWSCASCMTCNVRCPKGINIAEIIEALRLLLLRGRHDHLDVTRLSEAERGDVPPIALISAMRKYSA